MRLLGVRHGESEWNVAGRVQGQAPGVHLTMRGRLQALDAAERLVGKLAGRGASRLISSDQTRALETADLIAPLLGLSIEATASLREQGMGDLEGRFHHELAPQPVPEGAHINEVRWGGGESVADVYARLASFVERLRGASDGQTVILVTHAGPLQVLRTMLAGGGHRDVDWAAIGNGEVVELLLD